MGFLTLIFTYFKGPHNNIIKSCEICNFHQKIGIRGYQNKYGSFPDQFEIWRKKFETADPITILNKI